MVRHGPTHLALASVFTRPIRIFPWFVVFVFPVTQRCMTGQRQLPVDGPVRAHSPSAAVGHLRALCRHLLSTQQLLSEQFL
jgi:hypothetical protein